MNKELVYQISFQDFFFENFDSHLVEVNLDWDFPLLWADVALWVRLVQLARDKDFVSGIHLLAQVHLKFKVVISKG